MARRPLPALADGKGNEGTPRQLVRLALPSPAAPNPRSDASVREILLKLDQSMHFIIEDLDTNHLFVDGAQIERIKAELAAKLAENVYLPPDTVK